MKVYSVEEIRVAVETLVAFKDGIYVPDPSQEDASQKLATAAVSAALTIVATGLGEIIGEHERANSAN